jgi:putative component of membrane protein insertase Oxa1/YidC/SpoIIIJ protein YidD
MAQGSAEAAAQLETLIKSWTDNGWEYVRLESVETYVARQRGVLRLRCRFAAIRVVLDGSVPAVKYALLLAIRIYWLATPPGWRRVCLFRESCSKYVHRITADSGFRAGVNALRERLQRCRPDHSWSWAAGELRMVTRDGATVEASELSDACVRVIERMEMRDVISIDLRAGRIMPLDPDRRWSPTRICHLASSCSTPSRGSPGVSPVHEGTGALPRNATGPEQVDLSVNGG